MVLLRDGRDAFGYFDHRLNNGYVKYVDVFTYLFSWVMIWFRAWKFVSSYSRITRDPNFSKTFKIQFVVLTFIGSVSERARDSASE